MFTEILGILIIVGVLAIIILKKKLAGNSPEEAEKVYPARSGKDADILQMKRMQRELELTGKMITEQIGAEMDKLEALIGRAEAVMGQISSSLPIQTEEKIKKNAQPVKKVQTVSAEKNVSQQQADMRSALGLSMTTKPKAKPRRVVVDKESVVIKPSATAEKVHRLLQEGKSVDEIGRQLSIGKNAVEMILHMYK